MNKIIKMSIVVLIILLVLLGIGSYTKFNKKNTTLNKDFILISDSNYNIGNEETVYTNYNDYYNVFKSNILEEKDFKKNNYVLIPIHYNQCSESDILPTNYEIKGKKIIVEIEYKASCGNCKSDYIYYLLKVDKKITEVNLEFKYKRINKIKCDEMMVYKPIIYLYPQEKTEVTIKLGYKEKLTITYPKYKNEWKVIAYPSGDLEIDNNKYYALYWEGKESYKPTFEDGFIVKGEDIIPFLEEKLEILGLNAREKEEFIIYWLPKLEKNKYNLIRFETLDIINKNMPLEINPKPDTLIRVLMEFKPINKNRKIRNQELVKAERKGFTVIEWGGTEIK